MELPDSGVNVVSYFPTGYWILVELIVHASPHPTSVRSIAKDHSEEVFSLIFTLDTMKCLSQIAQSRNRLSSEHASI